MAVEYRTGDLFDQGLPALAQGCNTAGVMGAGIAKESRRRWPAMYDRYRKLCYAGEFIPGQVMPYWAADGTIIYNLGTQGPPGRHARLGYIRQALTAMLEHAEDHGVDTVGVPQIGAGIGGLRWAEVATVVEDVAGSSPILVVVVSLPAGTT